MEPVYVTELRNEVVEVVNRLVDGTSRHADRELCVTRLKVLAESALTHESIPLDLVDLLHQAINILKKKVGLSDDFHSYAAPVESQRRQGRPKFVISEEQLLFFRGRYCLSYV